MKNGEDTLLVRLARFSLSGYCFSGAIFSLDGQETQEQWGRVGSFFVRRILPCVSI